MKGFTLIELMIAIALGLIVIAGAISFYVLTISGSTNTIKSAQLNYDLGVAMTLMANDIKRSGYWGGAISGADSALNPFMAATERVKVLDSGQCVLYTYDASGDDSDSNGDDVETDEYYGFKLDSGTIRMRLTGATTADCSDGSWASSEIIDGDLINITALTFVPTYSCLNITNSASTIQATTSECTTAGDSIVEIRQVTITLTGQLVGDSSVSETLSETVMIRNNRIL